MPIVVKGDVSMLLKHFSPTNVTNGVAFTQNFARSLLVFSIARRLLLESRETRFAKQITAVISSDNYRGRCFRGHVDPVLLSLSGLGLFFVRWESRHLLNSTDDCRNEDNSNPDSKINYPKVICFAHHVVVEITIVRESRNSWRNSPKANAN